MENDMIKYARELAIVARFNNDNITLYKNVICINWYWKLLRIVFIVFLCGFSVQFVLPNSLFTISKS